MTAAALVMIVAVVLIVLALVYYLVSTILELRKITAGLDTVIANVGEILEKSAPVNGVVTAINAQLDAGVDLLEGLLVKKAGMQDAVGLVDGLYPGAGEAGFRNFPDSATTEKPRSSSVACRCRTASRVLQNTNVPGDSKKRRILTTACSTSPAAIRMARYSMSAWPPSSPATSTRKADC